ncbi:MAG: protein kinase [Planctomycetes bacterium]|nr:protein kinase [Planctomycetota bacterium]
MTRLVLSTGSRAGEVVDLAGGSLTIGADAAASNLALDGGPIASVHCRIAPIRGGGFGIQDLGSASGTFVNGRKITTSRLNSGDRIRIGTVELIYEPDLNETKSAPPPAAAPAPASTHSRLQEIIHSAEKKSASTPNRPADVDLSGKTLGGYQISGILGRGGMGIVYNATQTSLHRQVALKVLSPTLARDTKFVEMFLREARAAAQLHHPNVVTIFDVGSDEGVHYYSMELFDGGSAEQLLKRERKLSVAKALPIARDAARALEFAESRHLLHRDVKPDNLMITAQGVAKLADLGLASGRGEAGQLHFGTPHFVAPECLKGGPVDHRSDMYSLGATLYRMLTGRTPFAGTTIEEILDGVVHREAPALRTIDPTISEGVEALVARLLQKDPEKRFVTSRELVEAIEGLLAPPAKSTSKFLFILTGVAALATVSLGAYIAFKPEDKSSTQPVIIRNVEEENRLREENLKNERQMREKDAELAFTKVKAENLQPLDRAAGFEKVAKDFEGTRTAEAATIEAARIRKDEKTRADNEAIRLKAAAEFKNHLDAQLQESLDKGDFARALQLPKLVEGYDAAEKDPDSKAAIDIVPERVFAKVGLTVRELMNRAEVERGAGKFDAAKATYASIVASLDALLALPADQVPAQQSAELHKYKQTVEAEIAKLATVQSDQMRNADRTSRLEVGGAIAGALKQLRGGKASDAAGGFASLLAGGAPADAVSILTNTRDNFSAAAEMLQKLFAAAQKKSFGNDPWTDPASQKPVKILGIDENGIRIESKGAAPSVIAFDKLTNGGSLAQLFARAADKSAADQLLLARAALSVALAYDVAPLREYQLALKTDATGAAPPAALSEEAFDAAADAAKAAQTAGAPAAAELLQKIEMERGAARTWRDGLASFAEGQFVASDKLLGDLLRNRRMSTAFALSTDGSAPR